VQGGSSGIGVTAIQMAVAMGNRVFATAGSDEKCAACLKLGAEKAINYRTQDFVEVVRAATGGRGVDVVLDMVGAEYFARNMEVLATEGRLVQIAVQKGARAEVNLMAVMQKRVWITGSTLRPRTVTQKGEIAAALRAHVWPLVEQGRIRPIIHATFPLRRAADAHALLEAGDHVGKIVLVNRPDA